MSNGPSRMIFVKVLTYPLRLVDGLLDRLLAIAGAVALSQVPGFISHYLQRLGGHVDEATRNVAGWQEIANKSTGGNLRKLIDFYQASGDTEIIETGKKCVGDLGRLEDLQQAMAAIRDASVWEKPLSFVRHLDPDIARAASGNTFPMFPSISRVSVTRSQGSSSPLSSTRASNGHPERLLDRQGNVCGRGVRPSNTARPMPMPKARVIRRRGRGQAD